MAKFDNFKQYIEARSSFLNEKEALEYLQLHYVMRNHANFLSKRLDVINDESIQQEISMLLTKHKELCSNIQSTFYKFSYRIWNYNISTKYVRRTPDAKLYVHRLYELQGQTLRSEKTRKQFVLLTAFQIATSMYDGNDLKELYDIIAQKEPLCAKQIIKLCNSEILDVLKTSNSDEALKRFEPFAKNVCRLISS